MKCDCLNPRTIFNILLVFGIFLANSASAAFVISSEQSCYGADTYSYYISETALLSDYTVKVSSTASLPDITMVLVSDPRQADLIFIDSYSRSDMKVCKSASSMGNKSIKVSETALLPDITVKLSVTAVLPDYRIFIESKVFTKAEAAALFAVILKANKEQ